MLRPQKQQSILRLVHSQHLLNGPVRRTSKPTKLFERRCPFAARRLSALTLAALATGFYPDGSAPEPGFPQASADGGFARFAKKACRG